MWKQVGVIVGALTIIATIIGAGMQVQQTTQKIHSSPEIMQEAEDFFKEYDAAEVIANSVKEYVIDSIEEVNTQARWAEQQKINKMMLELLMRLDTNTRLNVQQSYQIKQLYEEGH